MTPQIRTITWSCGHSILQRLTTQNPQGATVVPDRCPYCGQPGVDIGDPRKDDTR